MKSYVDMSLRDDTDSSASGSSLVRHHPSKSHCTVIRTAAGSELSKKIKYLVNCGKSLDDAKHCYHLICPFFELRTCDFYIYIWFCALCNIKD